MNAVRKEIETENRAASGCELAGMVRMAQSYDHGCAARWVSECSKVERQGRSEGFVRGVLATLFTLIVVGVVVTLLSGFQGR